MAHVIARYGWKPDVPDFRDYCFAPLPEIVRNLPISIDLSGLMPPIYDQGQLGSCTANAIGAAFEYELKRHHLNDFMPARLFIYYNERAMEGTTGQDAGAEIRDGMKSIASQGVCSEVLWPYDISKFSNKPTPVCYTDALANKAIVYEAVQQDLTHIRTALASGYPVVFGFTVYDSFESEEVAATGVVNMPRPDESIVGGHAVVIVGYHDGTQHFIVRNSWGPDWGKSGYFTMPYAYVLDPNLADDFWVCKNVS